MSIFAVFYCALSTLDALFTCFSCNKRVLLICSASWSRDSFHSTLGVYWRRRLRPDHTHRYPTSSLAADDVISDYDYRISGLTEKVHGGARYPLQSAITLPVCPCVAHINFCLTFRFCLLLDRK